MNIVWTEPARNDLHDILIYISEKNPKAVRTLFSEINERAFILRNNPLLGRTSRVDGTRQWVIQEPNTSCRIV